MAIKMRVLYATSKKKMINIANMIKEQNNLAFNAVDCIPPAYSCDKERIVILAISAKGNVSDSVRLFCRELNKTRAQNVALMIDGDIGAANNIKSILAEAGTNVIDEVLYVKCGLFGSSVSPDEKAQISAWVDRVVANLK